MSSSTLSPHFLSCCQSLFPVYFFFLPFIVFEYQFYGLFQLVPKLHTTAQPHIFWLPASSTSHGISKLKRPKFWLICDGKQQLLKVVLHSSLSKITARKTLVNYFLGAVNITSARVSKISNLLVLFSSPLKLNHAKDWIKLEVVQ